VTKKNAVFTQLETLVFCLFSARRRTGKCNFPRQSTCVQGAVVQLLYGIVLQHWYVGVVNHREDYSKVQH